MDIFALADTQRRDLHIEPGTRPALLGLSRRELETYSLRQAILDLSTGSGKTSFEGEISRELVALGASPNPGSTNFLLIPPEVVAYHLRRDAERRSMLMGRRDLTVASASGGGYLVGTDNLSFIELARNRMVAGTLGATFMNDLTGNVTIPKETAGSTMYYLGNEGAQVTESQGGTYAQVTLTPKQAGAYTEMSRQLLLQGGPGSELKIGNDLIEVVAVGADLAAINGSGIAGQPTGILNTAGVSTASGTSFNASAALAAQVTAANALTPTFGYAATQANASTFAQRVRTGFQTPLWEGGVLDGVMCGARAMSSQQMPAATLIAGPWDRLILGTWGALQIEVNPFANFQAGIIGLRVLFAFDVAVTMPSAFTVVSSIT